MKMSGTPKRMSINYRLCDELNCKSIAMRTTKEPEYHLCQTHYKQYELGLADAKSNS